MSREGLIGACEILYRLEQAAEEIKKRRLRIEPEAEVPRKTPALAPGQKQLELFGWQELWRDWKAS